jgi:hypothetical protein
VLEGGRALSRNQQFIKLFVVFFFSTAFIFSFSYFGAEAFGDSTTVDGIFTSGTSIGDLDVSGKNKSEAASLLEEKYTEWLKYTNVTLQYQEKGVHFDLDLFHLNSKQTVDSLKDGQKNTASITIDKSKVEEQIQTLFPQLESSNFNINKLTGSLIETVSKFQKGTFTFNLYNDFLLPDQLNKDRVLSTANVSLKEIPEDLQGFIDDNQKIEIPEGDSFSLLGFINEKKLNVRSETLNIIATGIYQAILPSNYEVVERNISNSLPDYAQLGYEARVNKDTKEDLVFLNPNKEKGNLELQLENNKLIVSLKGEKLLYTYKMTNKDEQRLEPKTIIQYSSLLLPGKIKIQNNGAYGQDVKVYRDMYLGDRLMRSELISEDYYPPLYRVEIHSLAGNVNTGTQTAVTSTNTATNTQTSTTNTTSTDSTNQTRNQTTTDNVQPVSNETDLWGKPNEQPK